MRDKIFFVIFIALCWQTAVDIHVEMVQFIKVWTKFTVTKETGTYKFRIVEAPQECDEEIVKFVMKHFIIHENLSKATGLANNEEALSIYKSLITTNLTKPGIHRLVCCIDDDSNNIGEILGGSFMWLTETDDPRESKFDSKELSLFYDVVNATKEWYHMLAEQKVSKYYDGRMVVVHPDYSGLGIAQELFNIMKQVCIEENVPLTCGIMTAYGSQKAAERAGWVTVYEEPKEVLGKKFNLKYPEDTPAMFKIMIARVLK